MLGHSLVSATLSPAGSWLLLSSADLEAPKVKSHLLGGRRSPFTVIFHILEPDVEACVLSLPEQGLVLVILRKSTQSMLGPHRPVPSLCLANPKCTHSVYVSGEGFRSSYMPCRGSEFPPSQTLLEGFAPGSNFFGSISLRVPGLPPEKKKMWVQLPTDVGPFLAQRLNLNLN